MSDEITYSGSKNSTPEQQVQIGRLATDRYDFQYHLVGEKDELTHRANSIKVEPLLTITGESAENVQEALALLTNIANISVPDATTTSKGIIRLSGDLSGNATNILVSGLQGKPVSTQVPNANDILTWDVGGFWKPAPNPSSITFGLDLTGNNVQQRVVGISGVNAATQVNVAAGGFNFTNNVLAPRISQASNPSTQGYDLTIQAQSSTIAGGGGLVLRGGDTSVVGQNRGGIRLGLARTNDIMVSINEPTNNRRVVGLCVPSDNGVTSSEMPANTGDKVVYVGNATTNPTANPVNGAILYASGGKLFIRQSDGLAFAIGSIPDVSIWGPDIGPTVYNVLTAQTQLVNLKGSSTSAASAVDLIQLNIPNNTIIKVDAVIVGKIAGTADSASYNASLTFVRNGGTTTTIGSLVVPDPRRNGAATTWTDPVIDQLSNTLRVRSGVSPSSANIKWFAVAQVSVLAD